MIFQALDLLDGEWDAINVACAKSLITGMLFLGHRGEWFLDIQVGSKPLCLTDFVKPIFDRIRNSIYYRPQPYIGLPDYLTPSEKLTKTSEN